MHKLSLLKVIYHLCPWIFIIYLKNLCPELICFGFARRISPSAGPGRLLAEHLHFVSPNRCLHSPLKVLGKDQDRRVGLFYLLENCLPDWQWCHIWWEMKNWDRIYGTEKMAHSKLSWIACWATKIVQKLIVWVFESRTSVHHFGRNNIWTWGKIILVKRKRFISFYMNSYFIISILMSTW